MTDAPKKTRVSRKPKSADEVRAAIAATEKKLAELKKQVYSADLDHMIREQNIVSAINAIKAKVKGATDVAILSAIAKAANLPRIVVTKKPATARKK